MGRTDFDDKLLQEVDKLECSEKEKNIIRKLIKYELDSDSQYNPKDYDTLFEAEVDNNDHN